MSYETVLDRRIQSLERKQQAEAAFDEPSRWYELRTRPTCPPSKQLHISSGIVTPSANWGFIIATDFLSDVTCDFENTEETGTALRFANAGHYLPIILCYAGNWIDDMTPEGTSENPIFDNVVGVEVATALEAEAQIDAWMNGYTAWYYYRLPLSGVVFKNNGVAGVDAAIEAVDAVNRGRSYLYRDLRARHDLFG